MEDIEQELEAKSIERDVIEIASGHYPEEPEPEPEPVSEAEKPVQQGREKLPSAEKPKKVKKPRSEKQIAAFERAKQKRAENILLKKKQKEEAKIQKKELKKVKKETIAETILRDNDPNHGEYREASVSHQPSISDPVIHTNPSRPTAREQVVNNYYYYGTPPPQQHQQYTEPIEKKPVKKARPPTPPPEPESSSEEEEVYQPPPQPKPSLKFRFA
tara:strand:+ start:2699 stop:3346 length:648 start_codon:yes stop_codon:yes gene_type:complete